MDKKMLQHTKILPIYAKRIMNSENSIFRKSAMLKLQSLQPFSVSMQEQAQALNLVK